MHQADTKNKCVTNEIKMTQAKHEDLNCYFMSTQISDNLTSQSEYCTY